MGYKNSALTNVAQAMAGAYGVYKNMRGRKPTRANRPKSTALVPYTKKSKYSSQVAQDYRKQSERYGYRKSRRKLTSKLLKSELKYMNYSLRHYGIWNRGYGAVSVRSNQVGAENTQVELPVHLYDLTSVPNSKNATALSYPATFYKLFWSTQADTGLHKWETVLAGTATTVAGFGQSSTTADKAYCLYPTETNVHLKPALAADAINKIATPGAKSFLERINVKMILNGPQEKPTKWCIQLVQLKQEVTPGVVSTSPNTTNPFGPDMVDAFWASIAKPYAFSPLDNHLPVRLQKYIKVLKTYYISMDTPESGEDHLKARMRHFTLNAYLNRTCNYSWGTEVDRIAPVGVDIPENGYASNSNENMTCVHPNARVYLMIRALCEFQGPNVSPTDAMFPSYDIVLQTSHRNIAD